MPLEKSEVVILKSFDWSESSRTVHFFSREFGKLALVDRAGRRLKMKRGRLLPFSRMEVTFYSSRKGTSGYVSDSEIIELFSFEKDGTLGRLAFASAACELLYLLLPDEEPQVALYVYFVSYLRQVTQIEKRYLPAVFVAFLLRLLSQLGYQPSLAHCAGCGTETGKMTAWEEQIQFSPQRGGLVCRACQKPGEYYIDLSAEGAELLALLQRASLNEAASLPIGYQNAMYLIEALTTFLKYHSGMVSDLKSLTFLEKLKTSELNG